MNIPKTIKQISFTIFPFYLLLLFSNCNSQDVKSITFSEQRKLMVKTQLKARGISDQNVLQAMHKVERHLFVPMKYVSMAYEDYPLLIGEGQTISQPYIVAFMTEIMKPDSTQKVLEIGTGSGYQAAILGEICKEVYTIELIESLGKKAKALLKKLKYENVHVKIGDGYQGWKEYALYDAIFVTCAPTYIPEPLKEQLKEGGKMIIPVGDRYIQHLVLLTKVKGKIIQKNVLPVRFVPMKDEKGEKY